MVYDGERFILTILMVYLAVFGVIMLIALAGYILQGIGMYSLGKKRGMEYPWLAFIPFARTYYQGELCGTLTFREHQVKNPGIWMLLVPIVSNVITSVVFGVFWAIFAVRISQYATMMNPSHYAYGGMDGLLSGLGGGVIVLGLIAVLLISILASAIQNTLLVVVNHQIFARYTDRNYALLHAVMGIFIPLYTAIYFFIIRNRD